MRLEPSTLDATVAEQVVRFSADLSLLNEAV